MSDLIERRTAIKALYDYWSGCSFDGDGYDIADKSEDVLNDLPSAEPRKNGKWIEYTDCEGKSRRITCDQCGHEEWNWCNPKFCPNCGSYNGGEEE